MNTKLINMKKNILFLFFILGNLYSQTNIEINGFVIDNNIINDSISFHSGSLSKKLYGYKVLKSEIHNNKFKITDDFKYPKMYFVSLYNEKSKIPFREEVYFIDNKNLSITVSKSIDDLSKDNLLNFEYYKIYIPFITNGENLTFLKFRYTEPNKYDSKIKEYIIKNNTSYVGLWNLAERINNQGYKDIYINILNSFSEKIKHTQLWKLIYDDLVNIKIRLNEKFPILNIKDINNQDINFDISKFQSQFILIDFWFSRCRPCLEQFSELSKIYEKYNLEGFKIINISTDKTENIDLWKKRIIEKNIVWDNYLDENAKESSKEKIFEFPTNFLIDKNGIVIQKNISLEDLDIYLKNELTN